MDNIRNKMSITDFILNSKNTTKIKWIKIINNIINIMVKIMIITVNKLEIDKKLIKILITMNMMIYICKD